MNSSVSPVLVIGLLLRWGTGIKAAYGRKRLIRGLLTVSEA